ncbi:zona pellucida sperm-binding protein 1-like [Puntigrus tetrazona]|uniref:zona pellucida sperm-binding protein 1-like n=1 Tax=Puntigrus tetrazona TaxID=1606681 RepID=UPI001C8AEE3A|nr:zona pellucida sperm-binding protein 1-like [Puntigrus tetrazona]
MARQGVKKLILLVCCFEFVLSQGSKQSSTLDPFSVFGDDFSHGESDQSEVATQDSEIKLMKSKVPVYCNNETIKVILPAGSLNQVKILGASVIESVLEAPADCGYSLTQEHSNNVLVVDYTGCHVILKNGRYNLRVLYTDEASQLDIATVSCDAKQRFTVSLKQLSVPSDEMPVCGKLPPAQPSQDSPPLPPADPLLLNSKPGGCNISADQRVLCGVSGITKDGCLDKGCCFDAEISVCYYTMDECTADKNFVFAVHNDFANIPLNPMSLIVAGKPSCKPVISNKDFAIFKFSVNECGTHSFVIGETIIYLAEVQTNIRVRNLKYGVISRDNPIRLMVECRYRRVAASPMFGGPVLASAGYMVMSPSLPPYLMSEGQFGVQLLISMDETFTKFYPQCHQPLHVLLGKPVYLELRLKSPKPAATLIVHYCVAYPRSAQSALILLFDGCPNPLDPGSTSILYMKHLPQNQHQRRFEIKAFQFMDLSTRKYLNEEIYFMCSTEVCLPSGSPCTETCFDGKSP